MPATVADHHAASLFDGPGTTETVRRWLHHIPADDRPRLWERLEALERALHLGNWDLVDRVIARTPPGPVRDCLAQVASRNAHRIAAVIDDSPGIKKGSSGNFRHDGSLSRRYTTMRALCCPVNAWTSTGLRWLSADPDTFYGIDNNYGSHLPVALNWRHIDGHPIGLSRRWWLEDDGALSGEFWIPNTRLPQVAASLAAEGAVAPSIGFRFESDWTHVDPDEWDPHVGDIDHCRYRYADIAEVSLTPDPQFPTRIYSVN
jgi:hypothetical protein